MKFAFSALALRLPLANTMKNKALFIIFLLINFMVFGQKDSDETIWVGANKITEYNTTNLKSIDTAHHFSGILMVKKDSVVIKVFSPNYKKFQTEISSLSYGYYWNDTDSITGIFDGDTVLKGVFNDDILNVVIGVDTINIHLTFLRVIRNYYNLNKSIEQVERLLSQNEWVLNVQNTKEIEKFKPNGNYIVSTSSYRGDEWQVMKINNVFFIITINSFGTYMRLIKEISTDVLKFDIFKNGSRNEYKMVKK